MNEPKRRQVPIPLSLFTYFVLLLAVFLFALGPKGLADSDAWRFCIVIAPLFPFGLAGLFTDPDVGVGRFAIIIVAISYLSFLAFLVAFLRARTWRSYIILCVGFGVLLFLNIAGCRQIGRGFSGIH